MDVKKRSGPEQNSRFPRKGIKKKTSEECVHEERRVRGGYERPRDYNLLGVGRRKDLRINYGGSRKKKEEEG